jgi:hypothetical protein
MGSMNIAMHPALAQAYQADAVRNAPRRALLHELKERRRTRRLARKGLPGSGDREKIQWTWHHGSQAHS